MTLPMNPALNPDASQLSEELALQMSQQSLMGDFSAMAGLKVERSSNGSKKDRRGANLTKGIEKKKRNTSGSPRATPSRGLEENSAEYKCGYCGITKTSMSAGKDGHVRIRCECGAKHGDRKPRMHAKWHMVRKGGIAVSQPIVGGAVTPLDPQPEQDAPSLSFAVNPVMGMGVAH